jgi:hypothetical protein
VRRGAALAPLRYPKVLGPASQTGGVLVLRRRGYWWWSVFDASQCGVRRNEACFPISIGERTKAAGTLKGEETMIKILGLLALMFLIAVLARTKQKDKTAPFPAKG